jgi:F-type H+-transporting ATPase subunit gamma
VSRERVLMRRLRTLGTLHEAVSALRALSAQHFRNARALLPAARTYRDEVTALLGVLPPEDAAAAGPAGVVLVAADLGLVGDYASRLAREALALRAERGAGPLFCLGRRALAPLARAGVQPERLDPAPASVSGLAPLLLPLVDAILAAQRSGALASLWLVAARFEGAGHFRPVRARVLPVAPPAEAPRIAISPYVDPAHLRAVVVREVLYAILHETLLEALASEHGKRLVVAESARSWLDERIASTRRSAAALRRESSTQEVLEVAGAARAAGRERERGGSRWSGWTARR